MKIELTLPPRTFTPVEMGSVLETVAHHFYKEQFKLNAELLDAIRKLEPIDGFVTDPHAGLVNYKVTLV